MKKLIVAVATVFVAAVFVSVAMANPCGGTVVARGFSCGILDGNGSGFITNNSVLTVFQNKAVLQCEGNGAPATSLRHFNYGNTGLSCGMLEFGSTLQWDDKVGRAGNSQLTCTQAIDSNPDSASSAGAGIG
jgi:hypothetical protein